MIKPARAGRSKSATAFLYLTVFTLIIIWAIVNANSTSTDLNQTTDGYYLPDDQQYYEPDEPILTAQELVDTRLNITAEAVELYEDTYLIGVEVMPGRYVITLGEGASWAEIGIFPQDHVPGPFALYVKLSDSGDSANRATVTLPLYADFDLYVDGSVVLTPAEQPDEFLTELAPGDYDVGIDIAPGDYTITALKGRGSVTLVDAPSDGASAIARKLASSALDSSGTSYPASQEITLAAGQSIVTSVGALQLTPR
jgi:hypothetical protein